MTGSTAKPPYDQAIANTATAVGHCMKLGAVVLKPKSAQPAGFGPPKPPGE